MIERIGLVLVAGLLLPTVSAAQRGDIRIVGGNVHDGNGGAPRVADVVIRGDRIVFIGDASGWTVTTSIDARGKVVSPGYIDPHIHAGGDLASRDRSVRQAPFALMQGVTTVITGNDGQGSAAVAATLARYATDSIGPNAALLVGHGNVRGQVVGRDDRAASAAELARMEALVDSAMRGGALGLSSGLYYAPGSFASTDEVAALAAVAARHGGIYDSHIRDESSYSIGLLAAITEALDIGRRTGVRVNISHIKALGVDVHGQAARIIALVNEAIAEGVEVTADQYPWTASSTGLSAALLPRWAEAGGRDSLLARFLDRTTSDRIAEEMRENLRRRGGAASLLLTRTSIPEPARSLITGSTLEERARWVGRDPVNAAIGIIRDGGASVASFNMIEDDIEMLMQQPWVMTGSDGSAGHPRKYATYPRKLRHYVIDRGVITLERMIQASTSQVADAFGIADRGRICEGCFADVIVFDPAEIRENATYTEPALLAEGMSWVLVNGVPVVADGVMTDALPGRGVRRGG